MKKTVLILIVFWMIQLPVLANDFLLEFVEENYQESDPSRSPIIYHAIQVKTLGGSKRLILTGDNDAYRKWIREYIGENKGFIAVVPDTQTDDQTPENQVALALKTKAALEAETLRQEMDDPLKILGEQKAQEEIEKERIQSQLAELEIQRSKEEEKRKDEMEQRWQAFQKRMLEDESLRRREQTERYREMRRRWLEQQ